MGEMVLIQPGVYEAFATPQTSTVIKPERNNLMNTATNTDASAKDKPVPKTSKAKAKVKTVMSEFKAGALKSSSGDEVTNPKQAVAIALSEARKKK